MSIKQEATASANDTDLDTLYGEHGTTHIYKCGRWANAPAELGSQKGATVIVINWTNTASSVNCRQVYMPAYSNTRIYQRTIVGNPTGTMNVGQWVALATSDDITALQLAIAELAES